MKLILLRAVVGLSELGRLLNQIHLDLTRMNLELDLCLDLELSQEP